MQILFYLLATCSIISTLLTIFQKNPIYAIIYLLCSLLCISSILFLFGSFFAASVQIIIYAGAVMVLFIFIIMMLNIKHISDLNLTYFKKIYLFIGLFIIFIILKKTLNPIFNTFNNKNIHISIVDTQLIGGNLFTNYIVLVELISILLLSALIVSLYIEKNLF
ncbi:NADH-quinone oxidoreductase subunit J [Buchnera aphidicola]|uniref:NADH-quinone oxidoreductase subunit J n=1 Tax=Buchnera aphidicola (Anoecia oenotherae) TaxID=1241833 RepID=A0A4D6Y4C4_9GAMM|nr:NADH-quinone oxidoreductase subunit J [Buchnera aphidicola]QCI19265.1 NADH-quinone oxidoreductase subunit J [Buchnera aphidicola (Anoecia oenotherae)]